MYSAGEGFEARSSFFSGDVCPPRDDHPADVLLLDLQLLQGRDPGSAAPRLRRHLPRDGQAAEVRRIQILLGVLLRRLRCRLDRHEVKRILRLEIQTMG